MIVGAQDQPALMQPDQDAENFQRIWCSVYESVMTQTRDHKLSAEAARDACHQFQRGSVVTRGEPFPACGANTTPLNCT